MTSQAPVRIALKNILFATDFSPCSEAVLPYARSLARLYRSQLVIAHVSPELQDPGSAPEFDLRHAAIRQMEDLEVSDQLEGIRHKWIVGEGSVWDVLSDIIVREDIDLVVIGTHGRTGFKKFVMGSVAELIFRQAPCPVLIIGPSVEAETRRTPQFETILYSTDFSADCPAAFDYALSFAAEHNSCLSLITVAPQQDHELQRSLVVRLMAMLPANAPLWCKPKATVEFGEPAECIVSAAVRDKAHLIVLGAHRGAILTHHLMDTAYRVICNAPCPVLTVNAHFKPRD